MKLILTLCVIGVAWLILRNRSRRDQLPTGERTVRLPASTARQSDRTTPRLLAYALLVFMIIASGVFVYLQWRDEYRIVTVRVINTQTGVVDLYEARRGDVNQRQFHTLDGRTVNVADSERIEVGASR